MIFENIFQNSSFKGFGGIYKTYNVRRKHRPLARPEMKNSPRACFMSKCKILQFRLNSLNNRLNLLNAKDGRGRRQGYSMEYSAF
jgi:hypothetical protein